MAGLSFIDEVICVVDQDGDEKISAEELGKASHPSTLFKALTNFLDGLGDDLLEDLSGLLSKYKDHLLRALDNAIKSAVFP